MILFLSLQLFLRLLQLPAQCFLRLLVFRQLAFQLIAPFGTLGRLYLSLQGLFGRLVLGQLGFQLPALLEGFHGHFFNRLAPLGLKGQRFAHRVELLLQSRLVGLQFLGLAFQSGLLGEVVLLERLQLPLGLFRRLGGLQFLRARFEPAFLG